MVWRVQDGIDNQDAHDQQRLNGRAEQERVPRAIAFCSIQDNPSNEWAACQDKTWAAEPSCQSASERNGCHQDEDVAKMELEGTVLSKA